MSRPLVVVLAAVALGVGYFLGVATSESRRGGRGEAPGQGSGEERREHVRLDAEEAMDLRRRAHEAETLRKEGERLRAELADLKRKHEPKPGARREDGSIVGGAKWGRTFHLLMSSFIESRLSQFIREAQFSPNQERRFRRLVDTQLDQMVAITADFTNGDIDGATAYERLEAAYRDGEKLLAASLNDDQMNVYRRFEKDVRGIIHDQVVHNELAGIKTAAGLDIEQEKQVLAILDRRYREVGDKLPLPLPNIMLKPIRRPQDQAIYDATARAIQAVLRPEQLAAFKAFEDAAPKLPFVHRGMLVPK